MTESQTWEIYGRMSNVMADVGPVAKAGYNQAQKFNFRSIDDTVEAISKALVKNGVIVLPSVLEVNTSEITVGSKGTKMNRVEVLVRYTFAAPDGSSVETRMAGEAMDSGDKATNKALSAAFKYCLFQTFAIPTGEADADAHSPHLSQAPSDHVTPDTRAAILVELERLGITEAEVIKAKISLLAGRNVKGDLTEPEGANVLAALREEVPA